MGETEWAAAPEYEETDNERTIPAFLVGALAGMVVLAVVWAMTAVLSGTDGETSTDSSRAAATAAPTAAATGAEPSEQPAALPSPVDRCRQADTELARPLRAADPALDQWELHLSTMNKLVAGAITPEQAGVFWSQTKVGATRNLDRFDAAAQRVPPAGADCPKPDALAQVSSDLKSCARHVDRERQALEAAGTALRTWKGHIQDMKMLDMGHLSPEKAQQMWLANWHRGVREIQSFRTADRAMHRSRGC
jgi:hypothetical protein